VGAAMVAAAAPTPVVAHLDALGQQLGAAVGLELLEGQPHSPAGLGLINPAALHNKAKYA
jgi:hypothetical protein